MNGEVVGVAFFTDIYEAHAVRSRLEAEGIPVFLREEHCAGLRHSGSRGQGGRLLVPAHMQQKALAILRELEPTKSWAIKEPTYPRRGLLAMGLFLLLGLLLALWAHFGDIRAIQD